jgi:pyridoxamine 5'-phosphate oxidase
VAALPYETPVAQFRELLERAQSIEGKDARSVALATADRAGRPSVRMVVLAGVDENGFTFFTSYHSRKAGDLLANPRAAMCFHWPAISVQVRAEGAVTPLDPPDSDAYFATRPRGHQLAAWASPQSERLESRKELLDRFREIETRFDGGPVPRPETWGGYRLRPDRIEFWHGFENRLHDRLAHVREADGWRVERLGP